MITMSPSPASSAMIRTRPRRIRRKCAIRCPQRIIIRSPRPRILPPRTTRKLTSAPSAITAAEPRGRTPRGAPHHSQQYNFLLGSIGELPEGSATFNPGSHAGLPASAQYSLSGTFYLTNQCVSCHMQKDAAPANTQSHAFAFGNYAACLNCHPTNPEKLVSMSWCRRFPTGFTT